MQHGSQSYVKPPNNSFPGCNCSSVGAVSNVCNNMTGSCYCQPYVTGRLCDRCEENAFNYTEYGCMPCNCNRGGSDDLQCDSVSHLYALYRSDCRTYINIRNVPTIDQLTLRPHCVGEVWKRRFHPETASNVFRPRYAVEIWKRKKRKKTLALNHKIIFVCSSFSKRFILGILSVHT